MTGSDVYHILRAKWVGTLHHANTIMTSSTFLKIGGLASRGYIDDCRLPQTPQYSDNADKRFGIWYDVFTDGVDIHARGSIRNNYGPVLFQLPLKILLNLPRETDVHVTRKNPVHWKTGDAPSDRYFMSLQELADGYKYGEFGQHVIFRIQNGFLPFVNFPIRILLDDPQSSSASEAEIYNHAAQKLQCASKISNIAVQITKRSCRPGCKCLSGHKLSYDRMNLAFWF
jgi:hypothetical protein